MRTTQPRDSASFSENDAKDIILAEVLEKTETEAGRWNAQLRDEATRDARRLAGEDIAPSTFLPLRARLVVARMHERFGDAVAIKEGRTLTLPLVLTLTLVALIGGALTDRLATDGAQINLLSPPLLILLLWNLLVYLGLLLRALRVIPQRMPGLPFRSHLTSLFVKLNEFPLKAGALQRAFHLNWCRIHMPQIRLQAARALHLAAAAFAIGLLLGIAVRGIGTAYHVGWESTWLVDRPDLIKALLDVTYGLLPLHLLGLPPMPDSIHAIAAMNFADGIVPTESASAWIVRIMALVFAVVILPRMLLALTDTLRLKARRNRITLSLQSPYYRSLLSVTPISDIRIGIIIDTQESKDSLPEEWLKIKTLFKNHLTSGSDIALEALSAWDNETETLLNTLPPAAEHRLTLVFDPTATPEAEVHGAMMEAARQWCIKHQSPAPVICLDLTRLLQRQGTDHPLIGSRTALWQTFAAERHLRTLSLNLKDAASQETLVTQLVELWQSDEKPMQCDNETKPSHE